MAGERASRRANATAAAVVLACAAATGLLLSGWTPGPAAPTGRSSAPPAARPVPRPSRTTAKPTPARPTVEAGEVPAQVFADQCGVCHTLAAAGTTGRAGPNLDTLRPTRARVLRAIRNGGRGSGLMSPGMLTGADAASVARFVADSTRR